MSEFALNLWTALAILSAVVLVADLAERGLQQVPLDVGGRTESEPGLATDDPDAADAPAGSTGGAADAADDSETLLGQLTVYCEAHRDAIERVDDLGLDPAATAEDAVDATLEALAFVTGHVADVVRASVTGDLDPRIGSLVDAATTLHDETQRVLDDGGRDTRRAFLLAQFDDASYLQPLVDDDSLLVAALDQDACAELPLPIPGHR